MSEMSFEQMLEESFKTIRNGEVVEGVVIGVKPDEIILNIGYNGGQVYICFVRIFITCNNSV